MYMYIGLQTVPIQMIIYAKFSGGSLDHTYLLVCIYEFIGIIIDIEWIFQVNKRYLTIFLMC